MIFYLSDQQQEDLAMMEKWILDKDGLVAVICGKNGDMDTIASGICLASAYENLIACGIHQNKLAKRLVADLNAPFKRISDGNSSWPQNLVGIISVDAAGPSQLGVVIPEGIPILSIDHHSTTEWKDSEGNLNVNWDVRATTQIIYAYLRKFHQDSLTKEVRKLLLAGLITDTARFKHADLGAFQVANDLLSEFDIDYAEFVYDVESGDQLSNSDRGAILNALNKAKETKCGPWSLVYTSSGTLEGRVASTLINTGCDVSLVSRHRNGTTRLTARATRKSTIAGVHLGEIMESLAKKLGGNGGGHDGAAGYSNDCDLVRAESAFIAELAKVKRGDE